MNKLVKTGLLVTLLVVPVLIFLGLKGCGRNSYDIKVFYPEGIPGNPHYVAGQPHRVPAWSFTDQNGQTVSDRDVAGKVKIVDFFFSTCGTICPTMTSELTRVQDAFRADPNVVILSHTVDPETDSIATLKAYAQRYKALDGKWYFLTGQKEKLYTQARTGYLLPVQDGDGGPDDFIHSERLVLVDPEGKIRGYYNGTDARQVDTLILETKVLLSGLKK